MLQHAGIGAIVATKAERSQKTAEPLATALQIEPQIVTVDPSLSEANAAAVLEMIEALDEATPKLVIGHSNTLPLIINQLLGPSNIAIGHDEFDHIFVQAGGGLAHLRYHP